MSTVRPEVNLNFLGLLTSVLVILQCKVNTQIYNLTIFVSKRFYTAKCVGLLLDVVYFLCFALVYRPLPTRFKEK